MEPPDYARFATWQDDARIRKWNLWGYVDARDVATAVRLRRSRADDNRRRGLHRRRRRHRDDPRQRGAPGRGLPRASRSRRPVDRPRDAPRDRPGPRAARLRPGAQLARRAVTVVAADVGPPSRGPSPSSRPRPPADARGPPRRSGVALDGTWRFQLLHAPDAEPGRDWGEVDGPGLLDDAGHLATTRTTRTSRCRSRSCPPTIARRQPDRRLRARRSTIPAAWAGPAGRAPRRRRRERPDRRAQRRRRRAQQGLPPRRRVRRLTRSCGRAPNALRLHGREVVRRLVRRGPGPVVARRDHPPGVPLRDRPDLPRGRRDRRRAGRRPARPGTLDARGRASAGARRPAGPGWRVEAELDGLAEIARG